MNDKNVSCKECENSIYNERWGEYKCRATKRQIRNVNQRTNCPEYIKKKKKEKEIESEED